jgi:predicted transcriptional regulator of viral defense system
MYLNNCYVICALHRLRGHNMSTQHNIPSKTVGRQTAGLLAGLYDRPQSTFTLADAQEITGLSSHLASSLLHKAVRRGLVSRLKPGVFVIIPPELGSASEYAGDPFLTAIKLAGEAPCFISHASAMETHRMVTQPQLAVFASSSKRLRNRTVHGTAFRFVYVQPEHYFGTTKHWVTKQESVEISDLERTVIDGLRQPEYCGGITEVAKGLWMRHQDMQATKLVGYALRISSGAVIRRLGYLLELYAIAPESELARLRDALSETYAPLDPLLPKEGTHLRRWRLQLNITAQELESLRAS